MFSEEMAVRLPRAGHSARGEGTLGGSSRQGWGTCRVKVPVLSITCIQTASIFGACGGNEARSART
jgi:hypothetical protein